MKNFCVPVAAEYTRIDGKSEYLVRQPTGQVFLAERTALPLSPRELPLLLEQYQRQEKQKGKEI